MSFNESPPRDALRFGLEIEFLAPPASESSATPYDYGKDSSNVAPLHRQQTYQHLAKALNSQGLVSGFELQPKHSNDSGPGPSETDLDPSLNRGIRGNYHYMNALRMNMMSGNVMQQHWIIKNEPGVRGKGEHLKWIATELNSPIFLEDEATTGGCAKINKALKAIYEAHPQHAIVNGSCGMHVHVSPKSGMTPLIVKKAVTLVYLLEDGLLFSLCAPNRRAVHGEVSKVSRFAQNTEDPSRGIIKMSVEIAQHLPQSLLDKAPSVWAALWGAESYEQLERQIEAPWDLQSLTGAPVGPKQATISLKHFRNSANPDATTTVEFRHAQASFSSVFVGHWIHMVLTIFNIALLPTDTYHAVVACIVRFMAEHRASDSLRIHPAQWLRLMPLLTEVEPMGWQRRPRECVLDKDYVEMA